jgi:hypothetical protein
VVRKGERSVWVRSRVAVVQRVGSVVSFYDGGRAVALAYSLLLLLRGLWDAADGHYTLLPESELRGARDRKPTSSAVRC